MAFTCAQLAPGTDVCVCVCVFSSRLPTDLALPKVAVLPPKQRAVPAHVKAGWLNKLLASKEEMLEHIRERLSTGDVREAMTEVCRHIHTCVYMYTHTHRHTHTYVRDCLLGT